MFTDEFIKFDENAGLNVSADSFLYMKKAPVKVL